MSGDILNKNRGRQARRMAVAKSALPFDAMRADAESRVAHPRGFRCALRAKIAKDSGSDCRGQEGQPSKGVLRANFDRPTSPRVTPREGDGEVSAACLSVLTDRAFLPGPADYLKQARPRAAVLRKDFRWTRTRSTNRAPWAPTPSLLIAACLHDARWPTLKPSPAAWTWRCWEVHDRADLERALLKTPLVGINNRNLRTFEVTLDTTFGHAQGCARDRLLVTGRASQACRRGACATRACTLPVGEAFMRADDPAWRWPSCLLDSDQLL